MRQLREQALTLESGDNGGESALSSRILIVDDESSIRKLFAVVLSAGVPGVQIEAVENGVEALAAFEKGHHGVVLMDLHMPVMDGRTAFLKIQGMCREKGWDMPAIVFCTGYAPPAVVREAVNSDPRNCLLTKPVAPEELVEAVRERLVA